MPITPTYTWWEDEACVYVRLENTPVKHQQQVFCGDCVVKVNAPPYLLLIDLFKEVDDERSTATIGRGIVLLSLLKHERGTWGQLAARGSKAELQRRRSDSIQRSHARIEAACAKRRDGKKRQERDAVDARIQLERRKREAIQAAKDAELSRERDAITHWQRRVAKAPADCMRSSGAADDRPSPPLPHHAASCHGSDDSEDEEWTVSAGGGATGAAATGGDAAPSPAANGAASSPQQHCQEYFGRGWRGGGASRHTEYVTSVDDEDGRPHSDTLAATAAAAPAAALASAGAPAVAAPPPSPPSPPEPPAPPRCRAAVVAVEFTPTEHTHLPARQPREEELRAVRRKRGGGGADDGAAEGQLLADSMDIADRQPMFLKDKGDALHAQGNYSGAINAYSRALTLDSGAAPVWANRAACHLALGNHADCAADCDQAEALLKPQLERLQAGDADGSCGEDSARVRRLSVTVLARRAAAWVALARLEDAERDLREAARLDPGNAQLAADLADVCGAQRPHDDAAALRARADARFRAGDYEDACDAYTALLALPGSATAPCGAARAAVLGNRAACALPLQRYEQGAADCVAALEALSVGEGGGGAETRGGGRSGASDVGDGEDSTSVCERVALQAPSWGDQAKQRAAVRLLGRLGAALCYAKAHERAATAYRAAQSLCAALGDTHRSELLGADLERVLLLQQGGAGTQGAPLVDGPPRHHAPTPPPGHGVGTPV